MHGNIAHFANYDFVLISSRVALLANFAIWTLPFKQTLSFRGRSLFLYQGRVQCGLVTVSVISLVALVAGQHIKLGFEICLCLTLYALLRPQEGTHSRNLNWLRLLLWLLNYGTANLVHELGNSFFLAFFCIST